MRKRIQKDIFSMELSVVDDEHRDRFPVSYRKKKLIKTFHMPRKHPHSIHVSYSLCHLLAKSSFDLHAHIV